MLPDIRYALRTLVKQRSFTRAAVATLALGIAVNTLVFSLVNSLVLRPMPVRDASRVVRRYPVDDSGRTSNLFSYSDFLDYRETVASFDTLAAYIPADLTAGRSSLDGVVAMPRPTLGYVVSSGYFDVTGLRASVGRLLQPPDDRYADPDLRFQASPLSELLRLWMLPSHVAAAGTAVLAIVALLLASIGLYGVLTFSVGVRLRELGIRMALGADPRALVTLVLVDAWRLVRRGVAISGVCALLAAVALAAAYAPARRAARLDPLAVLRVE